MTSNPSETPGPDSGAAATGSPDPGAGGSHAVGGDNGPASFPSGTEAYPGAGSGAPNPWGQSQPGHYGQPQPGPYGDPGAYGQQQPPQQTPYGQPTPPPYGGPQPGYGDPGSTYQPSYGGQQHQPPYGQPGYPDPSQQGYPPQQYGQPGYPQQPYAAAGGQAPVTESDEKTWGIISHISIPFFGFIGPLIGYLLYKDRSPFLKQVTTEALNFGILFTIIQIAGSILAFITFGLINLAAFIVALIFCIMATMAASRHEFYKYPINARFIK